MSYASIAAALALSDVNTGERLAALSLASFANREQLAWPGHRLAAVRAGLSPRSFLTARAGLERRGLIVVQEAGGGRGNAAVIRLTFAVAGPWAEGEINAPWVEAVLSHSLTRGAARALLAAVAALVDSSGRLEGVRTEEIRDAAGLSDRSYRRARAQLLAGGELTLAEAGGGRGRVNRWELPAPETIYDRPLEAPVPRPVMPSARPLISPTRAPAHANARADRETNGVRVAPMSSRVSTSAWTGPLRAAETATVTRTASAGKGVVLTGVSKRNGEPVAGVSVAKGEDLAGVCSPNGVAGAGVSAHPGQIRRVSQKTPAETPAETPAFHARAGREPQNPQNTPPTPLTGGRPESISIHEAYLTASGRRRQRTIQVDVADAERQLTALQPQDVEDWRRIHDELHRRAGQSATTIWIESLSPAARDADGGLLLACPEGTHDWIVPRLGRVIAAAGAAIGRAVRPMSAAEQQLHDALTEPQPQRRSLSTTRLSPDPSLDHQEAV
jgi:hypothetical protein